MKSKTPPLPQLSLRRTASEPIKTRREDDSVDDLYKLSGAALQRSDYTAALALSEKILHYEQQKYGYYHAKVGNALHNVATVQLHAKRYKIAEPVFCEAVTVRIQALGNDHIDVATSLTKLGHVQTRLDKCDDAIKVFHDALRITRKLDDILSAPILSHIGCIYYDAAEFMAAQTTFQDALFIYRKEGPKAYRFITEMLCNIGSIQSKRKNFEGAIHSFSEGLELQKIIYRDNDTKVIATLDNLGFAYSKNKEYAQALTCYKEMLRAQLALYGTYNKVCFQTVKKQNLMTEKLQNNSGDSVTRSPPIDPAQHSIHRISGSPPNYNLYMHASPP